MSDSGKIRTGSGRSQNAWPGSKKFEAPIQGIEDTVFGHGGYYMPDTFEKAHSVIMKWIGAGNL